MKQTHCNNPSCGEELIHTEGRRPKKYCSIACRNAHYKVLYTSKKKENGVPLPKDFIEAKNIGILKEDGTIEKIFKWNGREMIMQPDEKLNDKIEYKEVNESSFDAPKLNKYILDEMGQWQKPDGKNISRFLDDRENQFTNAARGRDESGINEDEIRPITLSELKALCPPELTGFERSEWVSKKRIEYGV